MHGSLLFTQVNPKFFIEICENLLDIGGVSCDNLLDIVKTDNA